MSVRAAYLGVILIWATTPLAIKWSGEGPGFLFGVTGRMVVGALLALAVARAIGMRLRRGRRAMHAYLAAGLGIYGSMLCTYWAAQQIPSGWISVLFGLSPIMTGILARFCLSAGGLTWTRLAGALLGLAGLAVIFGRGAALDQGATQGIAAVLFAVLVYSTSGVCVKRIGTGVPALALVAGGLSVAAPLFALTWLLAEATWPAELPTHAAGAILYLAVMGSVVGFALFYHLLAHLDASRVALITLITPIAALLLGHFLNGEPLTVGIWIGAALVIGGLALFEFGDRLSRDRATEIALPEEADA
jgi:drug/metabolite transporter (DMT)-like permease